MKFLTTILFITFFQVLSYGQNTLKNYFPKYVSEVDLSVKTQNEIKRMNEISDKKNRSANEKTEVDTLYEKYYEAETVWNIEPLGCSWYCGGGNYAIKSSSALASTKNIKYDAESANDLSYETAWVEGKSDEGIGEFLEYFFKNESPRITKIIISNGYMKSDTAWKNNNRVKKLKFSVNGKPFGILNLEDSKSDQTFDLGTFGHNKNGTDLVLKFEILEVYKGEKFNDTAITEIYFDGIDVH